MYRVDLHTMCGWAPHGLFESHEVAEEWGYRHLRPSGYADAYRVVEAQPEDLVGLRMGLYKEAQPGIFLRWEYF